MTPQEAAIYVWQMNDGRWHVSGLGGRSTREESDANMLLIAEGFGGGFDDKVELIKSLREKGFRV
mgnify:CR=1 FL=1